MHELDEYLLIDYGIGEIKLQHEYDGLDGGRPMLNIVKITDTLHLIMTIFNIEIHEKIEILIDWQL